MTAADLDRNYAQGYSGWGTATVEKAGKVYIGPHSEYCKKPEHLGKLTDPTKMRGWPTDYGCLMGGVTLGIGLTREEYEALCKEEGVEPEPE